jgi:hypothetical protein
MFSFVATVVRFGMGIILTQEEENRLASIVKPCFAALGLANDYYSFDIEWNEFQQEKSAGENPTMTNAVWLYMQWDNLPIDEAKERVRQVVRDYETRYQQQMNNFIADKEQCSSKLRDYLRALAFQIPGNIVWSLRCPRYHPELCAEGEALLQSTADDKTAQSEQVTEYLLANSEPLTQVSDSESSRPSSAGTPKSSPSSRSSVASLDAVSNDLEAQKSVNLGTEVRTLSLR